MVKFFNDAFFLEVKKALYEHKVEKRMEKKKEMLAKKEAEDDLRKSIIKDFPLIKKKIIKTTKEGGSITVIMLERDEEAFSLSRFYLPDAITKTRHPYFLKKGIETVAKTIVEILKKEGVSARVSADGVNYCSSGGDPDAGFAGSDWEEIKIEIKKQA